MLIATRRVGAAVTKLAAKDALVEIARRKEESWRLGDSLLEWAQFNGDMIRCMLRHVAVATGQKAPPK
eukprot:6304465-Pyramimonas_sp.AAC.1